ncbi:MAG: heparin-binding hemagglutinin, partial [Gordonia sp. (in: high G+C Gram-positive bacteria)]
MTKSDRNLANPIYAAVGAGDLALKQVNEVIAQLRERTETATEQAQARFEETRTTAQSRIEETR